MQGMFSLHLFLGQTTSLSAYFSGCTILAGGQPIKHGITLNNKATKETEHHVGLCTVLETNSVHSRDNL